MENGQSVYLIINSQTGEVLERERVYVSLKHANARLSYWRPNTNPKVVEYIPNEEQNVAYELE